MGKDYIFNQIKNFVAIIIFFTIFLAGCFWFLCGCFWIFLLILKSPAPRILKIILIRIQMVFDHCVFGFLTINDYPPHQFETFEDWCKLGGIE